MNNNDMTDLLIFALVMTSVFSFFNGVAITFEHMRKSCFNYFDTFNFK